MINKSNVDYSIILPILDIFLAFGVVFFAVGFVGPLFGGRLQVGGMIHAASWVAYALLLKYYCRRRQKGFEVKEYGHLLIALFSIMIMFFWFGFPLNVILSIVNVVGLTYGYRDQRRQSAQ